MCHHYMQETVLKVTEHLISKGQTNKTFPNYVQLGDTICLNCYNGNFFSYSVFCLITIIGVLVDWAITFIVFYFMCKKQSNK